jgi:hypothetical protein
MLIAQMDGLELLPEPSELGQGVMAFLLLVVPLLVVAALFVWGKRSSRRRDDLEARIERLEENLLEEHDPKR